MGTPLPPEYLKPDGVTSYRSGTEWEFEDGVGMAMQTGGRPMVQLYRRTQTPQIGLDDPDFEAKRDQYRQVGQFFDGLRNADGSIRCGVETYESPEQFRLKLDQHLQHYAKRLLDAPTAPQPAAEPGLPGVIETTRETFRGFDAKPAAIKARLLEDLRQRLEILDEAAIAGASAEVKALLETLARVVQQVDGAAAAE
jgi:hypothetical protein